MVFFAMRKKKKKSQEKKAEGGEDKYHAKGKQSQTPCSEDELAILNNFVSMQFCCVCVCVCEYLPAGCEIMW